MGQGGRTPRRPQRQHRHQHHGGTGCFVAGESRPNQCQPLIRLLPASLLLPLASSLLPLASLPPPVSCCPLPLCRFPLLRKKMMNWRTTHSSNTSELRVAVHRSLSPFRKNKKNGMGQRQVGMRRTMINTSMILNLCVVAAAAVDCCFFSSMYSDGEIFRCPLSARIDKHLSRA